MMVALLTMLHEGLATLPRPRLPWDTPDWPPMIVEQDHRPVKSKMRAMMGFRKFRTARITIAGVELVNMLRKGQMLQPEGAQLGWMDQFFWLAFAA